MHKGLSPTTKATFSLEKFVLSKKESKNGKIASIRLRAER